ncbi:MAG: hypothetical protein JWR19_1684 [Pedosphaera sp.]|nr:hypothetical protein [Pedosphaera sp.]
MKIKSYRCLAAGLLAIGLTCAGTAQIQPAPATPEPGQFKVKYYGQFSELPVGAVQPRGWLQQWLKRQAQGLTGHPENMSYPYDTCMYAGLIPPPLFKDKWWKEWWPYEQSAYFVDATTRLSWLLNDPAINQRRDANLNYILDHSSGTNLGGSHWCWPNAVVGRALMAQYSATGNPRLAAVLQNWLLTSAAEIAKGGRNGANFEEAFYLYGLTGDQRLLDLGRQVYDSYLQDTNSFCTMAKIQSKALFREHGVTAAEELKCLPLMFSYTGDPTALRLAERAYQKVLDNNLMADGGIVSSEHLGPTAFYSVHESCDITDWSWSLGYLFMATGEARFADLIERTTFNALPGAVTKDFKQLQYFSAVNQTVIAASNSHLPHWPTRMTYRAAHDTECCAGNINRAMPNYVIRMWMRTPDDGLAAVYFGPNEVTTKVHGQTVTITEETDYPFRDHITFRIKTARPVDFNFQCRIPQWCDNATVGVNGQPMHNLQKPGTFASVRREFHDGDIVSLSLPMPVRIENWFKNQAVSFTRGPLVFSLTIAEKRLEHTNDPAGIKAFMSGHDIQGFPEVEFLPASDWRFGFAAAREINLEKIKIVESKITENPFIEALAPVHLEVPLCHLPGWAPGAGSTADTASEPSGLPFGSQLLTEGQPTMMTLVPYGATHLRLTSLPAVPSGSTR